MTKTSRQWRDKKINRARVINKIHNSFLRVTTGMMAVFFLLSILALDNVNKYVILTFCTSVTWLLLIAYSNDLSLEAGEE